MVGSMLKYTTINEMNKLTASQGPSFVVCFSSFGGGFSLNGVSGSCHKGG